MLQRPEMGTREHILLWLGGKDPDETYNWPKVRECACGQYSKEFFGSASAWCRAWGGTPSINRLNYIAANCRSRTFGELYEAATKLLR